MEKICYACKVSKPTTEFFASPQKKDGFSTYCKPCFIAKQKERYVPHPRPTAPDGMKTCRVCKELMPVDKFGSNKRNADGLQYECRPCAVKVQTEYRKRNPGKHNEYQKQWAKKNRQYYKDNGLKLRFGLEPGSYDKMLAAQNGVCAICDRRPQDDQRLHVDHCHDTGQIRGLLCTSCNNGIGRFRHEPEDLKRAAAYLAKGG